MELQLEGNNQAACSNHPSVSSSSGIFASIFAPPTKVLGRESLRSEVVEKKQDPSFLIPDKKKSGDQESETSLSVWNQFFSVSDPFAKISKHETKNIQNKVPSSSYQEEKTQPCHLSSSIYYGGQDIFSCPRNTQSSDYSTFYNDVSTDDFSIASRGNWWQGSLYY